MTWYYNPYIHAYTSSYVYISLKLNTNKFRIDSKKTFHETLYKDTKKKLN